MRRGIGLRTATTAATLMALLCLASCSRSEQPMDVRVVVVTMFERGEVDDDRPGELQLWVERLGLTPTHAFPLGQEMLYSNDDGVLAVLVGGGIPNATASIMALGLDERFDLSNAYWLVAGIAGGDPNDVSLGSAVWAKHIVDGDLVYEIDAREIPDTWPYGMVPLGLDAPTTDPAHLADSWAYDTIAYSLNADLVDWAFALTRNVALEDAPGIALYRKHYSTFPQAQRPPFVAIGDTMSSSTFWHGELMNQWANDWMRLYRGKDANFVTTNMEDSGTLTALHRLSRQGLVDIDRVLVLRTISNFSMPPEGRTAYWSKSQPYPDDGQPSFESAFTVGNVVVQALLKGWDDYKATPPQAEAQ